MVKAMDVASQEPASFIGVDLAWQSERNNSGLVALECDARGVRLVEVATGVRSSAEVLAFIRRHTLPTTFVAIDAPLVIPNETGRRECESLVSRRYGARHASTHSSNRRLYPAAGSVALAKQLENEGFQHVTSDAAAQKVIMEVYPHAGMVALFDLPTIIKYKKGNIAVRRNGLATLRDLLAIRLATADPALQPTSTLDKLLRADLSQLRGASLKAYEDSLDALFCGYLAAYVWRWGTQRNEVFGTVADGYIVNPILANKPVTTSDGAAERLGQHA